MSKSQKIVPQKGVDVDTDETYLDSAHAFFIKNLNFEINDNNSSSIDEGANAGVFTPLESNTKFCNLTLPAGRNYCCGYYESRELKEGYVFVYNSNKDHIIYRLNGSSRTCQLVYKDKCLNFQLVPKYFISEGRCVLMTTAFFNKVTDKEELRKYLIFTQDINDQRFISTEDAIATDSYNPVLFPFFNTNDPVCDRCLWINLGIAPPMDCIKITPVQRDLDDPDEKNKPNLLNFKTWQFRLKYIDVWGRESEHGVISDMYTGLIGGSCIVDSNGLPRCLKLKFKAGCPFVDQIQIEFRNCSGNVRGLSISSDWYLYDVIEKYNNCQNKLWYERLMNNPYQDEYDRLISLGNSPADAAKKADSFLKYDATDNTFEYTFCANKECTPLPVEETNRSENPLPLTSGSVAALSKGIALARNRRYFEPLDCKELNKITYPVTAPLPGSSCNNATLKKIVIWAIIYNPFENSSVRLRTKDGTIVFGVSDCSNNNPITYQQTLPAGQEGFLGYLAGTKNYAISQQYHYNFLTQQFTLIGLGPNPPGLPFGNPQLNLQRFEFNVLPGEYVFRLAGHRSKPTDDYQKTSTYLKGQTALSNIGAIVNENTELLINACTNDVEIKDFPLMIYDLSRAGKGCAVADATNVVEGYIKEDQINNFPIELAKVVPSHAQYAHFSRYTDHNGHYFAANRQKGFFVDIKGYKNCNPNQQLARSDISYDNSSTWYRYNERFAYSGLTAYPIGDNYKIKGKITLCNSGVGVTGALVVHTNGSFAYADANGNYTIIAHQRGDGSNRQDQLIFSQRGTCQLLDCSGNCVYCFPHQLVIVPACTALDRFFTAATLQVDIKGLNKRGPQMGGRYSINPILHDWMDRKTSVQDSENGYVDIPTLQQTQVYDYSTIGFNIPASIILPDWVKYISFAITENLNFDDFLTWVAERVQFIDNTGKVNTTAPTQIRLYYEGLGEYNKQNNFSTNTAWQFITDKAAPVQGDLIEFLVNGDSKIFTKRITALAKFDKEGRYILIDYTDDLKDLKDGAQIKLIRPKQCIGKEFYYSLCSPIRVVNNKPVVLSGTFNFFDSYLQSRQIPIPVATNTTNPQGVIITTTENRIQSFPYLFEHHSPSDFWGDHCWNKGKVNTKNPYENQQLLKTEICLSAALANNGVLNGLHYFTESNRTLFDEQQWAGITTILAELNTVLIICEHDNFVVTYDDTTVKVDERGNVFAPSLANKFGRPQRKIGSNYGCELDDINTIRRKDGVVLFLDRNKSGLIMHNYSDAVDVSSAGIRSWIKTKIKSVIAFNAANIGGEQRYFHAVFDPKWNDYVLTVFNLAENNNVDTDFVNDFREMNIEANETIRFNIYSKAIRMWCAYTPEYYGSLEGDSLDNQMFSFRRGEAWFHNRLRNPGNTYNNFFGTQTNWFIEVIANIDNTKVKRYLWIEAYCKEIRLYIDRIVTEAGQQSRLMPLWWDRREKFWTADFKCDVNTPADTNIPDQTGVNALLDGDVLYGRWLKARFMAHPDFIDKYFELSAFIFHMMGSEKSGEGK